MAGIGDYDAKSKGNRGFKMNNPMSQIANTKSHGTNANYAKSGVNMKDSPVEWAWLANAAKGVGKAAKVVGKTIGKGAKAVGKSVGKAVKGGGKEALSGEVVKKGIGSQIKDQAIGAARDAVTSAATDALKPKEKEHVNPTAGMNVQFGNK